MKKRISLLTMVTLISTLSGCSFHMNETMFYENYEQNKYIACYYLDENNEKQFGCIDYKGNEIVEFNKESIYVGNSGFISVNEEDKAYVIKSGKVYETDYKKIYKFSGGSALFQNEEGYYGIIDHTLTCRYKPIYTDVLFGSNNVYFLTDGNYNYCIDRFNYAESEETLTGDFTLFGLHNYEAAVFVKNSKYGVMNGGGGYLVKPQYKSISLIDDTAICVGFDGSQTLFNLYYRSTIVTVPSGNNNVILANSSIYYAYVNDGVSTVVYNDKTFTLPKGQIVKELYPDFVYAKDLETNEDYVYNLRGKSVIKEKSAKFCGVSSDGTKVCYLNKNNVYKIIDSVGIVSSRVRDANLIGTFGYDNFMFEKDGRFFVPSVFGKTLMETNDDLSSGTSDKGTFGVAFNLESGSKYYRNNGELLIESPNELSVEENAIFEYDGQRTNIYNLLGEKIYSSEHKLYYSNL